MQLFLHKPGFLQFFENFQTSRYCEYDQDGTNSKKEMQGIQTISKKGENTQLTSSFLAPLCCYFVVPSLSFLRPYFSCFHNRLFFSKLLL